MSAACCTDHRRIRERTEMEVFNYNDFLKTLWGSGLRSGFVVSGLLREVSGGR